MSTVISTAAVERAFESFALAMRKVDEELGPDPQRHQSLTLVLAALKSAIALEALAEPVEQVGDDDTEEQFLALSVVVIALCDHLKCWRWSFTREELEKCGSVSGRQIRVERKDGSVVLRVAPPERMGAGWLPGGCDSG